MREMENKARRNRALKERQKLDLHLLANYGNIVGLYRDNPNSGVSVLIPVPMIIPIWGSGTQGKSHINPGATSFPCSFPSLNPKH